MAAQQKIQTAWVKPPNQIGGLDHLAVQATSINIYGRLLPGITNVTDRARYYSFYPWLIWALDQRGHKTYNDEFVALFRRADCLFTLIAGRHNFAVGGGYEEHAGGVVGSDTLISVARQMEETGAVRLSDFSSLDGAVRRYFKNKLGGLGQYYLGVLRDLSIMDGDSSRGVKYTREIGQEKIAASFDAYVDRDLFLGVVEEDRVTASQLDALSAFCPCAITDSPMEQQILSDLFFVRGDFYQKEALPRRRTLQSILLLARQFSENKLELSENDFRYSMYSQALPNGQAIEKYGWLELNRAKWRAYASNELLSIAAQGLFFALLDAYEESGLKIHSAEELSSWYLEQSEIQTALISIGGESKTFQQLTLNAVTWLPALSELSHERHETQQAEQIYRLSHKNKSSENRRQIIESALRIFIALAFRHEKDASPYADMAFQKGYFQYYPINLHSFHHYSCNLWQQFTLRDWLDWLLVHWGVNVHFRVALRKLRGQSQSTFRLRPSDRGMEVIGVPPAVHTRPRFRQAVRILKDIGALEYSDEMGWQPSTLGLEVIEMGDDP